MRRVDEVGAREWGRGSVARGGPRVDGSLRFVLGAEVLFCLVAVGRETRLSSQF